MWLYTSISKWSGKSYWGLVEKAVLVQPLRVSISTLQYLFSSVGKFSTYYFVHTICLEGTRTPLIVANIIGRYGLFYSTSEHLFRLTSMYVHTVMNEMTLVFVQKQAQCGHRNRK